MYGPLDFFSLGFKSIVWTNAFSHVLFIIALCGVYTFNAWKRVAVFILAFLTGYMGSFTLQTLDYMSLPPTLMKFLIPVSIIMVAFSNYFLKRNVFNNRYPDQNYRYLLAFIGGIIHGFSFPDSLNEFLFSPTEQVTSLLAFNSGILLAIAFLVTVLLSISFVLTYIIRMNMREWNLLISGACVGIALYMLAMSFYD